LANTLNDTSPQLETSADATALRLEISDAIDDVLADWQNTENDGRINDALTDRLLGVIAVAVVDSVNSFTDKITADELRRLAALAEDELNGWVRDLIRRSIKDPEGRAYRDADRLDLKFRYHRDRLLARAAELDPRGGAA
jgi:hypothetical protein